MALATIDTGYIQIGGWALTIAHPDHCDSIGAPAAFERNRDGWEYGFTMLRRRVFVTRTVRRQREATV